MKKETLRLFILMTVTLFLSVAFTSGVYAYPGGAPAGYTGSPGDGQTCTKSGCHNGTATTVSGWITSTIPAAGYTPGTNYTMTVSVTGSGNHGFEVSPQNVSGTLLGTLIAGSGNKLVGSGKYVTHSSSQSGNPQTWSFQWVAPAAGTGTLTFYGAFCVVKNTTKLSTLVVNENTTYPLAVVVTATPSSITVGQTSQLNAAASGGSGSYTYAWTSVPPGFTSTLQNPVVSPTVTTQYIATVNDGTNTVQGNATVTVTAIPLAVTATATPSSILVGQTSQLNAIASGGAGTYTYAWTSVPPGFTSTLQNPVVAPIVTTQYFVTVNDGTGTAQGNVTVTVTAVPLTATATATPSLICVGQNSQLNVVPAGGSGNYTYSWTSNPPGFTSTLQNPVVSPTVSTQYTAHVSDGTSSADAPTYVTVNQPATAFAGNDTTCAYVTTQIPLNGTAANFSSVLWTTSGTGTFSAASSLTGFYYPSAGDKTTANIILTLTASAQAPCSVPAVSLRHIHIEGPTAIGDSPNGQPDLIISPNPSTGIFSLRVKGTDARECSVIITDMFGKKILQQTWSVSSTSNEQIDLSGYPKGFYLVKVQTEKGSRVRKVVIE